MICDWLTNWEYLFPGKSCIKIDVFSVRCEKIFDVYTEDRRKEKKYLLLFPSSPGPSPILW